MQLLTCEFFLNVGSNMIKQASNLGKTSSPHIPCNLNVQKMPLHA